MNIIDPIPFVAANITTNIPITEVAWTASTHHLGDRRYILPSYDLYEVVVASTTDEPTVGAAKNPQTWTKVGKVNAYNCFDGVLTNATVFSDGLDMSVSGGGVFKTGIALFGVVGGSVRITLSDGGDDLWDQTYSMVDVSNKRNAFEWLYAPPIYKDTMAIVQLPPLSFSSSVRVRIDGAGSLGECAIGYATNLGKTRPGVGSQVDDYSTIEFNTFGQPNLIQRGYSTSMDVNGFFPTENLGWVKRELAARRAKQAVFIGSQNYESTIAYGLFRDIATAQGQTISDVSLKIKGIV